MTSENQSTTAVVVAQPATLAPLPESSGLVSPFADPRSFEAAQRMAKALASSSLVPQIYRGEQGIANCLIAPEMASRVGVSVMATMQNLHVIQGKPGWSSSFLIASVNASGRFTPIRFEWSGTPGKADWACRARAKSKEDGEMCVGSWITWQMVEKEGWSTKAGSKWKTMPEQMFIYRAAAFWQRSFCPEIGIGFHTAEEVADVIGVPRVVDALPADLTPAGAASLKAVLGLQKSAVDAKPDHDPVTGEVKQERQPGDDDDVDHERMERDLAAREQNGDAA